MRVQVGLTMAKSTRHLVRVQTQFYVDGNTLLLVLFKMKTCKVESQSQVNC